MRHTDVFNGRQAIGTDSHGREWFGSEYLMIVPDTIHRPDAETMDRVVGDFADAVVLERRTIDVGGHLLMRCGVLLDYPYGTLRVYDRPDGAYVCVRDDFMQAVEDWQTDEIESEEDEARMVKECAVREWRQPADKPLAAVGAFDHEGRLVAVVMPVRVPE